MQGNIGRTDRLLRATLIAPLLVIAGVAVGATTVAGIVLSALATTMLATAAIGWCPLYRLVGVDTRERARTP